MIIACSTTLYGMISYSVWAPPIEPASGVETIALEFNTSAIGDCQLTRGSDLCFGNGMHSWFRTDLTIEDYDTDAVNIVDILSTLRQSIDGGFGISDQKWEECKVQIYRIGCGSFHQMCDYSCKPIRMCDNICQATLEACGNETAELFHIYLPVFLSVIASVGIEEHEVDIVFQDAFSDCKTFYTNESDSLCMNIPDMYETNLAGIDTEGVCTPENAIRYEQYLESLNTDYLDSFQEALEQYQLDIKSVNTRKTLLSMGLLLGTSIFEYIAFFFPKYRREFFDIRYKDMNYSLSVNCRLRILFMAILAGFLCFILHSTVLQVQLQYIYTVAMLLCTIWSGYTAIVALFHQDRIAYQYVIKERKKNSNSVQNKEENHPKLILKLLEIIRWYNKNFSNVGKYQYWKFIISEIIEIALQVNVMLSLSKTEDYISVLANITIISANLMISPLLLLHPSPAVWRTLNRIVDSFLDIAYMTLLYITLTSRSDDNTDSASETALVILLPALRLTIRLDTLFRSVIRDFMKIEINRESQLHEEEAAEIHNLGPNRINKTIRFTIMILFVSCGLGLLSSTFYRVVSKTQQCKQEIGENAWCSRFQLMYT